MRGMGCGCLRLATQPSRWKERGMEQDYISLKWRTLKGWDLKTDQAKEACKKYIESGTSASAMMQHDTPEQKELLCKLIDVADCEEIYLDWDGVYVSKEKAKEYIMEADKKGA